MDNPQSAADVIVNPAQDTAAAPEPQTPTAPESAPEPTSNPTPAPQETAAPTEPAVPSNDPPAASGYSETDYTQYAVQDNADVALILDIFKEKDVPVAGFNEAFSTALQTGNVADINEDALVKALGPTHAAVVLKIAKSVADNNQKNIDGILNQAYTMFGGENKFKACVQWTTTIQDPVLKAKVDTYKRMVDAGGEETRLGLQALRDLYMTAPTTSIPSRDVHAASAVLPADAITTRAEYFRQYQDAHNAKDTARMADINRRWQAGKKFLTQ